ncbi:MgtC/SapB family protein [Rhodoblastus sp.]|uniref:MgtC/SapB family protein n=1 Tax=Rhodoblastus sp. TaxID=1962975 RepID=UPI003F97FC74
MLKIEFWPAVDLTVSVVAAFLLATLIGAERQYRQRSAGLRTNVLVAIGAATFVSLGFRINGAAGASQIAAYVVSGIGFLGAGAIMKEGSKVWGLNTAATLWRPAAIGALSGYGLIVEATIVTAAAPAGNTLLRPLVNAINRAPFDERRSEATYEVLVMTEAEHVGQVRDRVVEVLEEADYPVRDVEVVERSDEVSEVIATLVSTAVEPAELDAAAEKIAQSPHVSHASWSSNAEE